ncbi:hypothetical protein PF003_g34444 [Phytophthora fragariae]|nr:hypothetical protein PF003_g34444 [Phytophthora fragariae]
MYQESQREAMGSHLGRRFVVESGVDSLTLQVWGGPMGQ